MGRGDFVSRAAFGSDARHRADGIWRDLVCDRRRAGATTGGGGVNDPTEFVGGVEAVTKELRLVERAVLAFVEIVFGLVAVDVVGVLPLREFIIRALRPAGVVVLLEHVIEPSDCVEARCDAKN